MRFVRRPQISSTSTRVAGRAAVSLVVVAGTGLLGPAVASATPAAGAPSATAVCRPASPGFASCTAMRRTDIQPRKANKNGGPLTPNPAGYSPTDLRSAYNIPALTVSSGTVAIVDAYDDPNAASDLGIYRKQWGIPACTTDTGCFQKVGQTGSTTALPNANNGWAGEIALDTDMVSTSCPLCHILLVEANSASNADLAAAENYAASVPGVVAISNSYGGSESSSDVSTYGAAYNHPNVAITASTGDSGYGVEFPAASPYVIAVGGTSLVKAANPRGWTETVWNTHNHEGTGSGCSAYEKKPSWQTDSGCARRTLADISADADPATGVAVYDSYGSGGWVVFGGTSVASPLVAGMYALAGSTSAQYAYAVADAAGLNDVTVGQNTNHCSSYLCEAIVGYDGPTGNGTPNGLLAIGGAKK